MAPYQDADESGAYQRVHAAAEKVDALVAVVTGGDPLFRPAQSIDLIEKLSASKSIVVDTSGVGGFTSIAGVLRDTGAHMRISLDSADKTLNDRQRPINRRLYPEGTSSWELAVKTIDQARGLDIPVSVQTVLTRTNTARTHLEKMREFLQDRLVAKWVVHMVVSAGKASQARARPSASQPHEQAKAELEGFLEETRNEGFSFDVRVTNNHARNSVILIDTTGNVNTEASDGSGKRQLFSYRDLDSFKAGYHDVDMPAHYRRYLNLDHL